MPFITIPDMHGCVYNVVTEKYLSIAGIASQSKKTLPPNSVCVSIFVNENTFKNYQ